MSEAPDSPLDKKEGTAIERELTMEERVKRLEVTLENAFNYLGKEIHQSELRTKQEGETLQAQVSKTLTLMNMSTLQNIVAIRELIKTLVAEKIVDGDALDKRIQEELAKAIEAQQKVMQDQAKAAEAAEAKQEEQAAQ